MGDGDGTSGGDTIPVSMDDLKKLETSLTSSMDAQMKELRSMMAQLLNANNAPAPPSLEDNASATQVEEGEGSKESLLKLMVGRRSTMGFRLSTPSTHLSRILI